MWYCSKEVTQDGYHGICTGIFSSFTLLADNGSGQAILAGFSPPCSWRDWELGHFNLLSLWLDIFTQKLKIAKPPSQHTVNVLCQDVVAEWWKTRLVIWGEDVWIVTAATLSSKSFKSIWAWIVHVFVLLMHRFPDSTSAGTKPRNHLLLQQWHYHPNLQPPTSQPNRNPRFCRMFLIHLRGLRAVSHYKIGKCMRALL